MKYIKEHLASIGMATLLGLVLLLCISPDSYTHDVFGRGDSAWYYLCGKSWMSGLTPYIDFSDSKGPLLWLIYGIGYLLSPHSYHGVFWLTVIFYAFTFYFTYRTAHLFLGRRLSWIATAMMAFAYFNPFIHYEIRSEDYCLAPMVLSLYVVCQTFYNRHTSHKHLNNRALLLGASFGFIVMIKYNIAVMQLIFPVAYLIYAWRRHHGFWRLLGLTLGGMTLIIAPFIVWLTMDGALGAFVHEYFAVTFETMRTVSLHTWYVALPLFIITLIGAFLMRSHLIRWIYFPAVATVWMFAFCLPFGERTYYYVTAAPLLVFLCISLLKLPPEPVRERMRRMSGVLMIVLALLCIVCNYALGYKGNLTFTDHADKKAFYDIASTMSRIASEEKNEHPTVVYFNAEDAYDVPSGAVAGCKYFSRQRGELPSMLEEAKDACRKGTTDFVLVGQKAKDMHAFLDSCGYEIVAENKEKGTSLYLTTQLSEVKGIKEVKVVKGH